MGVLERDPARTAATLVTWFEQVAKVGSPSVGDVSIPASTGWSNETILFDASWTDGDGPRDHALVARIAPSGHQVFPDDTFLRQHAVMHALAQHTDVPVPHTHWLEQDPAWFGQPFWIMDRVEGQIPTDAPPYAAVGWLHDATPEEQTEVWWAGIDAMALVHRVDPTELDLPPGTFPVAASRLDAHLHHHERFLTWAEGGVPHDLSRRALGRLLRERPPEPPEGRSLVWGDSRLSNLIFRDRQVVAVLDWEMCALGDPQLDLGYWIFADWALTEGSGATRLAGFASKEETARRWAAATGRSADAVDYFELFAGLRFTVIMLRMGALLADMGLVPPEFARDNLISQALEELLARP